MKCKKIIEKATSDKQFIKDEKFYFKECSTLIKEIPQIIKPIFYCQLFEGYVPNIKFRRY